jgi:GT2 family glycosyltransferase
MSATDPCADGAIWLRIDADAPLPAGRWVEIAYHASLYDRLERPAILFRGADGAEARVFGAAPVFGCGAWIGRVPDFAREAWISPLRRGAPRFRIVSVRQLSIVALFARAFASRPGLAALAAGSMLAGDAPRAVRRLGAAFRARPLTAARRWAATRRRAPDWEGLERPSRGRAPHLRLIVADATAPWIAALAGPSEGWSIRSASPDAPLAPLLADLADDDLVAAPGSGAALVAEAAAIVREAAHASTADLLYADEAAPNGGDLRLKPDWSPILAARHDLVGQAWFARVGWARKHFGDRVCAALTPVAPGPDARVEHVRRVLLFAPAAPSNASPRPTPRPPPPRGASAWPWATIVIPTRDRGDLLAACLARLPPRPDLEIVIVDNGSVDPDALVALAAAARDPRARVLRDAAAFNFSRLCNLGAAAARAPLLVFLNDDVQAGADGWLDRMAAWALRADVGAVGAKLLYPDGRLQHGGVTLGMGGRAAHAERLAPAEAPGYFGRLDTPHEVSAVTAACLAVEARKFFAVDGFDAVNLPVDLNDVDLCLRLAARGWRCVMEPRAVLTHHESASRGAGGRDETRYAAEIAWFRARWAREIGDDPYFHPALSLDVATPALD